MIIILSTFTALSLFSILTGVDNPFFALIENIYVGGAVGLTIVVSLAWIINNVLTKILSNPYTNWPLVISLVLGLTMLTRLHPKYSYLARIPICVATGVGVAISTRAIVFSGLLYQIRATIAPIFNLSDPMISFTNLMVVVFVITALSYFIYTYEIQGPLRVSNKIGRLVLYTAFGVLYAQTYMGRVGLLLGRMETLIIPETNLYITVIIGLSILVSIIVLTKYYPETMKKLNP